MQSKRVNTLKILYFFFLFCSLNFGQNFKFAWLTDTHVGTAGADIILTKIIRQINLNPELKFVIHTGDITEKGLAGELELAKKILSDCFIKVRVIPGNHDLKWSETGGQKYYDLFGDDKFYFEHENIAFIGINSGIVWRGGGGHISPETLTWLKSLLPKLANKEILLFVHHPLNDTDNGFFITNLLSSSNVIAAFVGHGHKNQIFEYNELPCVMARSTLSYDKNLKKDKGYGFNIVEINADSIKFFETDSTNTPKFWGGINRVYKNKIRKIDSLQFINYGSKIIWQYDLNATVISGPLSFKDNLYIATYEGKLYGFGSYGDKLFEFDTEGKIVSSPGGGDDFIIVGNVDGDLYTLDAKSGMPQQTMSVGEPITSAIISFKYAGNVELMIPSPTNSCFALGTGYGKFLCYDLHSLQILWENSNAKGMIETKPLIINNRIIYGSWDNFLYMIDARNGLMIWRWTENRNFYFSPAVCSPISDGKNIYVATPDNFVSAIDFNLARSNWRKNEYNAYESLGSDAKVDKLFVKSKDGKFYIIRSKDGSLIKKIDLPFDLDVNPNSPIEYNNQIIFGSQNGFVYLIDKNYDLKPLLFMGNSRLHTITELFDGVFAAVNIDGKIVVFSLK